VFQFNVQRSLEQPASSAALSEPLASSGAAGAGPGPGSAGSAPAYALPLQHHPPSSAGSVSSGGGGGVGSPGSPPLSAPPRHKEEDNVTGPPEGKALKTQYASRAVLTGENIR